MIHKPSSPLTRRKFLCLSAASLGAALLAGCMPGTSPTPVAEGMYYLARKEELLKNFDDSAPYFLRVLEPRYGSASAASILHETREAYAGLIPQIPYIGGAENMLTENLVQSTWALALYRVLKARGEKVQEVGKLLYTFVDRQMNVYPHGLMRLMQLVESSSFVLEELKTSAAESQKRRYPYDWVYTIVEGDGEAFDWGIDYAECGVCKFYRAQNAVELTPYLCLLDFPMSRAADAGLVRKMTLANGDAKCDFRYQRGRETAELLPPGFLEASYPFANGAPSAGGK